MVNNLLLIFCILPKFCPVIIRDLANVLCTVQKLSHILGLQEHIQKSRLSMLIHIFDAHLHVAVLVFFRLLCHLKILSDLCDLRLLLVDPGIDRIKLPAQCLHLTIKLLDVGGGVIFQTLQFFQRVLQLFLFLLHHGSLLFFHPDFLFCRIGGLNTRQGKRNCKHRPHDLSLHLHICIPPLYFQSLLPVNYPNLNTKFKW